MDKNGLSAFLLGLGVGVGIGILFAPKSGEETREYLRSKANEGGVEGEGGWYRRNWLVPLPEAVNLEGLNAYLRQGCEDMLARVISGRTVTTGEAFNQERPHLQPLAAETFELEETTF